MTNSEILQIALVQSALELNCQPEDLLARQNKVVLSASHPKARAYLQLPFGCNLVSYGSGVVASVQPGLEQAVAEYLASHRAEACFETPALHELDEILASCGLKTRHQAEYFLPDINLVKPLPCSLPVKLLTPAEFSGLYLPQWSNALCQKRKQLDRLAAAAYDGETIVAMAGCSADCQQMWQIGIDVLPDYRRQGLAAALTSRLAAEILALGKVPFYCAAWSNIGSVRNAIKSGFRSAWVELTGRDAPTGISHISTAVEGAKVPNAGVAGAK